MLDIIHKDEYFNWLNETIAEPSNHSLKGIQDGWVLSLLAEKHDLRIAEVGGANSRVLKKLGKQNECWNIDKFEGVGQGPTQALEIAGVKIVRSYLGDFDPAIPDRYFDVVFSVSVVEHVPTEKLESFFADCHRILKPGGMMAHAIDLYIFDTPNNRLQIIDRYRSAIENQGFEWHVAPALDKNATFRCSYASNSDIELNRWNQVVPSLQHIREIAQSVSIKLIAFKQPDANETVNSRISLSQSNQNDRVLQEKLSPPPTESPQKHLSQSPNDSSATSNHPAPAASNKPPLKVTQAQSLNPLAPSTIPTEAEEETIQLATALAKRVGHYYSRWPALLAGIAIVLNTIALFDEVPLRWAFMAGGTIVLLFLVGHAASKADYVLAEVEQLKIKLPPAPNRSNKRRK